MTEAGENLKKLLETPVQLGWVNPRGLGKVRTVKTKSKDSIGDRMKSYESHETLRRSMKRLPICVRVDGRAFHTFTRGLDRPFDEGFSRAMIETAKGLMQETHAKIAYTQSDEITLVYWSEAHNTDPIFGGKLFKLTSVLASLATGHFMSQIPEKLPSKIGKIPSFDCRVFQTPNLAEAANLLLWRWIDARKNSISMAAQAHFSPKQLHKKAADERLEMLSSEGVTWEDFPDHLKWGTFLRRENVERLLTEEELDGIPEKHRPEGPVVRTEVVELDINPYIDLKNKAGVIFENEKPDFGF